jgi:hypothetical protein
LFIVLVFFKEAFITKAGDFYTKRKRPTSGRFTKNAKLLINGSNKIKIMMGG